MRGNRQDVDVKGKRTEILDESEKSGTVDTKSRRGAVNHSPRNGSRRARKQLNDRPAWANTECRRECCEPTAEEQNVAAG